MKPCARDRARVVHNRQDDRDHLRFAESLVPVAARLIATVHDEGPEAVAAILAATPDGRHDALAVVLAAMVDPDRSVSDLLVWTHFDPIQRVEYERLIHAGVTTHAAGVLAAQAGMRQVA